MLSYRHAFHAGNHADVLKHLVLSRIIAALCVKDKPFSYIDSHAGAGLYGLDADQAVKTGEAAQGILSLMDRSDIPELALPYLTLCRDLRAFGRFYPGSPEVARALSRTGDQLTLMELHPTEIEVLRSHFSGDSRIHIHHCDGFAGLTALCPPEPRRGLALVDPSYELVEDYSRAVDSLLAVNRRWSAGILVLWYPLVERRAAEVAAMKSRFASSGIAGILCAELTVGKETSDSDSIGGSDSATAAQTDGGFGLEGSGMLIVRPPWLLNGELEQLLPWLAGALGRDGQGSWRLDWLTAAR